MNRHSTDLITRLRLRAVIRRQITTRKSVQEGKADRLSDLLEEAAARIEWLETHSVPFGYDPTEDAIEIIMENHLARRSDCEKN
jgi:predicted RNA-binding Zn ribbon-like protein